MLLKSIKSFRFSWALHPRPYRYHGQAAVARSWAGTARRTALPRSAAAARATPRSWEAGGGGERPRAESHGKR